MRLLEIQAHLNASGVFDKVNAVLNIDQMNKQAIRKPVAFITPTGTSAESAQAHTGRNEQRVTETYAVIYCIPSINDPTGIKASETLQNIIKAARGSLLAFAPGEAEKLQLVSGEMISIDGGFAIWQDQFNTRFYIEEN